VIIKAGGFFQAEIKAFWNGYFREINPFQEALRYYAGNGNLDQPNSNISAHLMGLFQLKLSLKGFRVKCLIFL